MAKTPFSQTRFLWAFSSSALVWAFIHALVLSNLGASWQEAGADSAISNLVTFAACVLVSNNLQYYLPKKERYWYILAISIFLSIIVIVTIKYGLQLLPFNSTVYLTIVEASFIIRICIVFLQIAATALISVLWYTYEEKQQEAERLNESIELVREAELLKLRQQLQPHFLFNSLNSINALIGSKPAEARNMVQQLSSFLRSTLRKEENQWVTLREELEQLELYLSIEKVRFGNRLQTIIDTAQTALDLKIPAMLLQPLVENAIKFGLYGTVGDTTIELHAATHNNQLLITISNPFDRDSSAEQGTGFGLTAVKRRLYLLFARNDLVETTALNQQFTVRVTIPQP